MASVSITQADVILVQPGRSAILVHGGLAYNDQVVVGMLRQQDEDFDRIIVGQNRAADTGTYTIVFIEIPDGGYTLEIYESPGMRVAWRDCEVESLDLEEFVVSKQSKDSDSRLHIFATIISTPAADGATVPMDFLAGGTATSANLPAGTMTPTSGSVPPVNGVRPTNSNSIWTLEFPMRTATGPKYDLAVNVPGSGNASRTNLTVR